MDFRSSEQTVDSYASPAFANSVNRNVIEFGVLGRRRTRQRTRRDSSLALAKRCVDIIGASVLLIALSPFLALVALAIICVDGFPVVFAQERIGQDMRRFRCFKFRTMVPNADRMLDEIFARDDAARRQWELNHKLDDDPRVTRIGRLLRKASLDELPQLVNVLRGEMSLVGPRPIVEAEAFRYGRYIENYFDRRPGLTGVWQVYGRSAMVEYRRRVAMDVWYMRHQSFSLDLMLLLLTVGVVLRLRGV